MQRNLKMVRTQGSAGARCSRPRRHPGMRRHPGLLDGVHGSGPGPEGGGSAGGVVGGWRRGGGGEGRVEERGRASKGGDGARGRG